MRSRRYRGYTNMGRIRIPPTPPAMILTDRGTGTQYLVSFSTEVETVDGYGHIIITDSLPNCARRPCTIYNAGEEPYIGTNPLKRLYIRDGRLGMEVIEMSKPVIDRDNAPLSAVKNWDRNPRVIVDYTGDDYSDRLAWMPWSEVDG